ncbi:TRAP transporter permease [Algihabitans albus]|uniref:TRAP transporter permease n=1 Tax=Algihabitans albus TaxID=2164067 RepID=UPI000E5CF6FB|nr:TRAP transporter fused permease subunit [Algihabitans albus]
MIRTLTAKLAGALTDEDGDRRLIALLGIVGIVYVLAHAAQIIWFVLPSGQFKIMHVGGAAALIFLSLAARAPKSAGRAAHLVLALLAAGTVWYVFVELGALTSQRSFLPNATDLAVATVLLVLCLYASLREWGWTVSLIAIVGLLYGYFGQAMPEGLLYHGGLSLKRLIGYTSIPYFSGLLGGLAELSAGTIFPFMLLAAALQVTGCVDFIMGAAYRIGGRTRAGPAQVAILSSGMMGMVSGSSVANVASTGALTIPLMNRVGFKPAFSGAVEAVASTGGQITPPVMGLAAFLIVGLTGVPYGEVIIAAAFPALIYYLYLMFAVHLRAVQQDLDASAQDVLRDSLGSDESFWRSCLHNFHFFIAVTYLVWTLIETNLAGRASIQATALLIGLYILRELVLSWRGLVFSLSGLGSILAQIARLLGRTAYIGALRGAQIAVVVAVIGVLVDILSVTGFAQKLSFAMLELAGGDLWLLLVVAALACLAFGLGLPTSASYILVALMGAPALVSLGVPLLAAHFFVFFFANVSAITPPVAVSCLVAAKIANGDFLRTSFIAVRLGLPGFILPFIFVIHPELLGIDAHLGYTALIAVMALLGVVSLNVLLEGFLLRPLTWPQRISLLPAILGLLHPNLWASLVGIAILGGLLGWQWTTRQRAQDSQETEASSGTTLADPPSSGGKR